MKKFIKNLKVIDRVMQFELDQIQLELGQLQSDVDQISRNLQAHQMVVVLDESMGSLMGGLWAAGKVEMTIGVMDSQLA